MGNIIPISSIIISVTPFINDTREQNDTSIICLDKMEKGLININNNSINYYIFPNQWHYDKQLCQRGEFITFVLHVLY